MRHTFFSTVTADLRRLLGAVFGHVALSLTDAAGAGELTRRSVRTLADHVALLAAVVTLHDLWVRAVGFHVASQNDQLLFQDQRMRYQDSPRLAAVEAISASSALSLAGEAVVGRWAKSVVVGRSEVTTGSTVIPFCSHVALGRDKLSHRCWICGE